MTDKKFKELVAPAGDVSKLETAWLYGADSAYIGFENFSLRARAGRATSETAEKISALKNAYHKKLYGAFNSRFTDEALDSLKKSYDTIQAIPFDAFIVSDPGAAFALKERFPSRSLHLSTQADCTNSETARFWKRNGIDRIVPSREMTLTEIRRLKDSVPELEIEAFCHGAMCLSYSGRCFLSATLTPGRSANRGECSHPCRWDWRVLEESKRPGIYFPVEETSEYSAILSPRDMKMLEHIDDMISAGVDAFKIEGRMRSEYYVAVTARAYRKALDASVSNTKIALEPYIKDLDRVSHRDYSTGFYYGKNANISKNKGTEGDRSFIGIVRETLGGGLYSFEVRNNLDTKLPLEYVTPEGDITDTDYAIVGEYGNPESSPSPGRTFILSTRLRLSKGCVARLPL